MNNKKNIVAVVVVLIVILIIVVGFFVSSNKMDTVSNKTVPVVPSNPPVNINEPTPVQDKKINPDEVVVKAIDVHIKNFAFDPASLDVKVGDTVIWTNNDDMAHSIVMGGVTSSILSKGDSFSFVFDKVGSYSYHCGIHPSMKGVINVK